jgi:hypothetical protein
MLDFRVMIPEKVKMIQFSAYDPITGLTTGNGGIQIWDKKFAEDFEGDIEIDHENIFVADDTLGAVVVNNTTPEQAYTEAYKEIGKLLSGHDRNCIWNLFADIPCKIDRWKSEIVNSYLTMGMDVPNGEWSIIGARHALLEVIKHGSVDLEDIKLKQDTDPCFITSSNACLAPIILHSPFGTSIPIVKYEFTISLFHLSILHGISANKFQIQLRS